MSKELDNTYNEVKAELAASSDANELTRKAFEEDVYYTDLDYESDLDDAIAYGNDKDVNAVHEKYNKAYTEIEEKYGMKIDDLRESHMKAVEIESERLRNERIRVPDDNNRIKGDGKRPLPNVSGVDGDEDTPDYD